jgi:hypothetical protein
MLAIPLLLIGLSGCSSLQKKYLAETDSVDTTSAYQLTDREVVEDVDLAGLLARYAPNSPGRHCIASDVKDELQKLLSGPTGIAQNNDIKQEQARLDRAAAYFACKTGTATDLQQRIARNALQERLLAASQQRCNAFKGNLQRTFSRTNFGLGVATVIAGTAGALVSSLDAARNWSGAAAIFSGARSEFNQDYMSNLAAHVIVDGIEKRRQFVYDQIQKFGQKMSYAEYPVEAAIKDAFYYHGECSVVAGFRQASDAIKYANDPGLATSLRVFESIMATRAVTGDTALKPDEKVAMTAKIVGLSPLVAGSALGGKTATEGYYTRYRTALGRIPIIETELNAKLDALRAKVKAAKNAPSADELGLKASLKASAWLDNDKNVSLSCSTTIENYYAADQVALAKADAETNEGEKSKARATSAAMRSQGDYLANTATVVADNYAERANQAMASWDELLDKALVGDAKSKTHLKKALGAMPAIDDGPLFKALKGLCQTARP